MRQPHGEPIHGPRLRRYGPGCRLVCSGPGEWASLADVVEASYFDYDGFVILHGTDTMAYTASALSFMLQGLGKPVVVGPAVDDFKDIVELLRSKKALIQCDKGSLQKVLSDLIESESLRSDLSRRAIDSMTQLGGASIITADLIESLVDHAG